MTPTSKNVSRMAFEAYGRSQTAPGGVCQASRLLAPYGSLLKHCVVTDLGLRLPPMTPSLQLGSAFAVMHCTERTVSRPQAFAPPPPPLRPSHSDAVHSAVGLSLAPRRQARH
jgi:hypothetical protein